MSPIEENGGFYLIEITVKVAVPLTEAEEVMARNKSMTNGSITYIQFIGPLSDMESYRHMVPNVSRALEIAVPDRENNYSVGVAFETVNDAAILHILTRRPAYHQAIMDGKVDPERWKV